ncbi:UDP-N-acetylglucosamine 2-epimerase [Achromobacter sp. HNDS-1]|jgi:GDP/UDP-N,N'-diacetylbacillosamine 2-epimerase (hydrolysing)|uniref:UDP-N-acetylglucosamine 2-epimerase n=1 Tax=Achromobacter sp. HNDS-1 TaxID=3151598 RepID=A0AAU7LIQ0_9BURK|nr:UDP-N-acetylglucosamine 2-epimerase [Achromobacter ruhlandii]MCI1835417.1 UDP-N-acetylglucosamine 2-epimerase [Achromobacter ruhlandii]CAB3670936.1 UDP-N,N'-diacetylbacillosamine 2-epimerase (hydrolyzing) [Achromobacter ruhlandii]
MRRIVYISGTRADYGLMAATLHRIQANPACQLSLIVTGMHLSPEYGNTVAEIEHDGLPILARIVLPMNTGTGAGMARAIGYMVMQFSDVLEQARPDIVLLLGDRGEMLAGAIAAAHLGIPIVHIHGGERSGTIDEPVRHAISKLAHWHCVATQQSRDRLIRMGEQPRHITVTGAPGLDGLAETPRANRTELCQSQGLDPDLPLALMVFHPVVQEADRAAEQVDTLLRAVLAHGYQLLALKPNSDAGSTAVAQVLESLKDRPDVRVLTHLRRPEFIAWMAAADLMIGNSSSGIIEAATFGTPVINVGSRQNLRERNPNVRDCDTDAASIEAALKHVRQSPGRISSANVYGDGHASERIAALLTMMPLDDSILMKSNAY